jgi:hypothetical protein
MLNDPKVAVVTDRGAAVLAAVVDQLPLAHHQLCALHIERNLVSQGFSKDLNLYWEAQRAVSRERYDNVMLKISQANQELATYLNSITGNWQLFHAVEKNLPLYEMKSDNLVEQIFSWLKEERCVGGPLWFSTSLFLKLNERLLTFKEDALQESPLVKWAQEQLHHSRIECKSAGFATYPTNKRYSVGEAPSGLVVKMPEERNKPFRVDFGERKCSCARWQQTGVPCAHAVALWQSVSCFRCVMLVS